MTEHIIVDSHCHLDFPDFDGEIPDLVARANDAGVKRMVTICTKLKNEPSVRKIAEEHEAVYYAAGTHPMSAASEPLASVDQLIEISQHPKMVGIGETGLDYHYTAESAEIQKTSLKIHIEAARETNLPLIIHSRAADEDMAAILKDEFKKYNIEMEDDWKLIKLYPNNLKYPFVDYETPHQLWPCDKKRLLFPMAWQLTLENQSIPIRQYFWGY